MGADGTIWCPFDAKKSRNFCLTSAEVMEEWVVKNGLVFDAKTIFARNKYKNTRFGVSLGRDYS
jgi:hypothetical protein